MLPLSFAELQETKTAQFYALSHHPLDYRILVMDEDQDRIYVGSKDHILSLNINNISQDPLSVSPQSALGSWDRFTACFCFQRKEEGGCFIIIPLSGNMPAPRLLRTVAACTLAEQYVQTAYLRQSLIPRPAPSFGTVEENESL